MQLLRQRELVLLSGLLLGHTVQSAEPAEPPSHIASSPSAGLEFFEKRIRPLLLERCYKCHSEERGGSNGGLSLDSREKLLKGGDSGPAIVPHDAERSLLIRVVLNAKQNPPLPLKHQLAAEQLADLVAWVKMGAPDPRTEKSARQNPKLETPAHWSFQPLRDPPIPQVRNGRWPNDGVDHFILARLEKDGLAPNIAADRRTLIRRATFDLIGLPPTPVEIEAFVADRSPRAFEKVINRLLASPSYGERWGRHWLDLVRYADTAGDSSDYPIPQAYLYRNYVINSFNRDKPYDEFLREQIAGDLLPAVTQAEKNDLVIATGFLAMARRFGVEPASAIHLTIEDTLETMGRAVLGLSLSCARCHDHKYDPITMRDYYALYGIFSSTRYPYAGSEERKRQSDFVPLIPEAEVNARLKPWGEKLSAVDAEIARIEKELATLNKEGLKTSDLQKQFDEAWKKRDELTANPPFVETAYAVAEGHPANARVQKRGDPLQPGEEVPRRFLKVLGGQELPKDCQGSGRLELTQWLTDPANPLTPRVMVNRIWQYHFGTGLVRTPSDFGTRGRPPTHPKLLDYLAARFIESGWSVKAMHKLIMLSATYQQSSEVERTGGGTESWHKWNGATFQRSGNAASVSLDPDNELLWHFNRQRFDAEEIRDALLALSGQLDREPGGPHPFPPENKWNFTQHNQFSALYDTNKRSVYVMQQRIKRHPFFAVFDGADPNAATAERTVSVTPLQALFAMNDKFMHEQAEHFAAKLLREKSEDSHRIDFAHQLAFGRFARPQDIREGLAYLQQFRGKLRAMSVPVEQQDLMAWASYARALLGSNEFLFLD